MDELLDSNAVYCFARALVLGIIVSSEALLARRRRVAFERHLILFGTFAFLMAAELFGVFLAVSAGEGDTRAAWVWYPVLTSVGLLGVAFCFDYVAAAGLEGGKVDAGVHVHSRHYLLLAGVLFALGAVLAAAVTPGDGPPTSSAHLGPAAFVLHGIQLVAIITLAWKAIATGDAWLTRTEGRVFALACLAAAAGAIAQIVSGPREHFSTFALTIFVAVLLRDDYRRSQIEAVRATEDRREKMLIFHRITTHLKSTFELSGLYEILMDSLVSNLGAESGAIYVRDGDAPALHPAYVHGPFPPPMPLPDWCPDDRKVVREVVAKTDVPLGEGVVGQVVETGTPLYVYDLADARRHYTWKTGHVNIRTAIALPLRSPEGVYGAVQIVNRVAGGVFDEEDLRFMSLLVGQAGLAIYNARLHAEIVERQRTQEQLKVARQIQLSLTPRQLPEIPGLSVGTEYRAAQEVGGDYFDFYRIDHDHLGVLVLDVAGKGVPGALLMAITGTFLKMAAPRDRSPAWVLNEVNAALSAEISRGLYVTAVYGVLQISTRQFTLCSAGHPEVIVVRERDLSCEPHKPRGAALGMLRPNHFRAVLGQEIIQLEPGDTLLLYTDGVLEAMNDKGEEFGWDRLCRVAQRTARKGPRTLTSEIAKSVAKHAGAEPQYDDITVVALGIDIESASPDAAQEPE